MFTWLRRLVFGKTLEEHLDGLRKMQDSLESFGERTQQQMQRKEHLIERLNVQTAQHAADIARSTLVRDNLELLMTKPVATEHAAS